MYSIVSLSLQFRKQFQKRRVGFEIHRLFFTYIGYIGFSISFSVLCCPVANITDCGSE